MKAVNSEVDQDSLEVCSDRLLVPDFEASDPATERLLYVESVWRLAAESAQLGVWDYNALTDEHLYSDGWKRIRGIAVNATVNDNLEKWLARIHPDDRERMRKAVEIHNAGENKAFVYEYRERHASGKWVWILSQGRAVAFDANGKATRLLGTDHDITRFKEEELRRTAEITREHRLHILQLKKANMNAERARAKADKLSSVDYLSGLANRRVFTVKLAEVCEMRLGDATVCLLDLNGFKPVNDRYGHAAGDHVIKESARRLQRIVGQSGLVARLGGDEFGIVLLHSELNKAGKTPGSIATQICHELAAAHEWDNNKIEAGVSVGLSNFPTDAVSTSELLKAADCALYKAKEYKCSNWVQFDARLSLEIQRRMSIELDLKLAIADQLIEPFFQPIIDQSSGVIDSMEILARWNHPIHGAISPEEFIPIISQFGLLAEFSSNMLRKCIKLSRAWPEETSLSLNLTAEEVCNVGTLRWIDQVLAETGFPARLLKIEVTEQALVENAFAARQVIDTLRQRGVQVFLDDFGAGYSGLRYLRDMRFDGIKIDRSFAMRLGCESNECSVLIESLLGLAAKLKMKAVVEGIESAQCLKSVLQIGGNLVQGYYFSKPVTAALVPAIIHESNRLLRVA